MIIRNTIIVSIYSIITCISNIIGIGILLVWIRNILAIVTFITNSIGPECDSYLNKIADLRSEAEEKHVPVEWDELLKALETKANVKHQASRNTDGNHMFLLSEQGNDGPNTRSYKIGGI